MCVCVLGWRRNSALRCLLLLARRKPVTLKWCSKIKFPLPCLISYVKCNVYLVFKLIGFIESGYRNSNGEQCMRLWLELYPQQNTHINQIYINPPTYPSLRSKYHRSPRCLSHGQSSAMAAITKWFHWLTKHCKECSSYRFQAFISAITQCISSSARSTTCTKIERLHSKAEKWQFKAHLTGNQMSAKERLIVVDFTTL